MRAVGIDSAGRLGWVGVLVDDGGFVGARLGSLVDVIGWAEPVAAVGVDIPIGGVAGAVRQADVAARRFVGARSASVFAAPPAEVLHVGSYAEANQILAAQGAPMLSRQAWALVPKMVEAATVAGVDPRVIEVHPEVSFCAMGGAHLARSKKSWNGLHLRRRLLAEAGVMLPDDIPEVAGAATDDVVDAAAAAWSALRVATGRAECLPASPEQAGDRQVAIWF